MTPLNFNTTVSSPAEAVMFICSKLKDIDLKTKEVVITVFINQNSFVFENRLLQNNISAPKGAKIDPTVAALFAALNPSHEKTGSDKIGNETSLTSSNSISLVEIKKMLEKEGVTINKYEKSWN